MNYTYDTFLKPLSTGDTTIQIKDTDGIIQWIIDPFSVINVMVNNNLLKINVKNRVIIIGFSSLNESKLALSLIQEQLDSLKTDAPNFIDKRIENYINDIGTIGATGPAGSDGAVGPTGPAGLDGAVGPTGPSGNPDYTETIIDITSSDILNLSSAPVLLLPAPPVNQYYSYYGVIEYTPGNIAYSGTGKIMIGDIFEYVGFILNNWWLINTNTTRRKIEFNSIDLQGASTSTYSGVKDATFIDKAVYFALFSGVNYINGNGTIKIKIYHKTISWG